MLNTKIEDRKSYIKANALFAKVPYLNGGLFSPSEIDCYHSNELGGYSDIKCQMKYLKPSLKYSKFIISP
ncbi:hypothetical protein [Helicobacter fennelliae]|uniref:hypothetical protein n=1 Tax=Helicobacter fennelliae TaxID=215 RepID=UPI00406C1ED7